MRMLAIAGLLGGLTVTGFSQMTDSSNAGRFDDDVAFLRRHTDLVVLGAAGGPQVAVAPAWQGRVMTSTPGGDDAIGHGWINYALIASGQVQPHINALGGEDRFWMGPEGGQFAIFFEPGDPFDLDHWQTPAAIDTEAYTIRARDSAHVALRHRAELTNYSGTAFSVQIDRSVRTLDAPAVTAALGVAPPSEVRWVAYASENTITNVGEAAWTKREGLLSIWILGMFRHSPETTVVIPYRSGPERDLGPIVNDAYFGAVPPERLVVGDAALFFSGDGQFRSKIGLTPQRAMPTLGSYDPTRSLLTIVQYSKPDGVTDYVNSMWEIQAEPYAGDVINSYNDGPPAPGATPLGPFYELETSSPAAALGIGEALTHHHRTFHFQGPSAALDRIARAVLGVQLSVVERALR